MEQQNLLSYNANAAISRKRATRREGHVDPPDPRLVSSNLTAFFGLLPLEASSFSVVTDELDDGLDLRVPVDRSRSRLAMRALSAEYAEDEDVEAEVGAPGADGGEFVRAANMEDDGVDGFDESKDVRFREERFGGGAEDERELLCLSGPPATSVCGGIGEAYGSCGGERYDACLNTPIACTACGIRWLVDAERRCAGRAFGPGRG
jgi:hypothetical protein